MLKIDNRTSQTLSLVLTGVLAAALVFCAVIMVPYTKAICVRHPRAEDAHIPVLIHGYLILIVAAIADGLLFRLLRRIGRGAVFTDESIALLRGISWCCIAAAVLFFTLGFWFLIAYAVSFIAFFVGICLRVVKNVLSEAARIKSENDLTV